MTHTIEVNHQRTTKDGRIEALTPAGRIASEALGGRVDVAALEMELKQATSAEVRFDLGSRALYATDASNYRQVPIGVVVPRTVKDAATAVQVCLLHGAPSVIRGVGTALG